LMPPTPPSAARAVLYGSLCMAAGSCGVMGMLWGHFGMCARVLRAARSWPAHAAPRTSPVFAGSRSSSMSGAAGGVSHGSVVSVVGNVPSCVPGGRDASREDLQIGVDESGRYVVLVKQLVQCARIVKASAARDDWTFPPFPDGFENLINLFAMAAQKRPAFSLDACIISSNSLSHSL